MLDQFLALLVLHASSQVIVTAGDRIARPAASPEAAVPQTVAVRVEGNGAVLWDGTLRVATNQSASYQQHVSQPSPHQCPPDTPHDRSERRQLTVSIYAQEHEQTGRSYRVDVSWQRPIPQQNCLESGTRTVQITQAVPLAPGETRAIEGDAGLRVSLTLAR